jgi:hypothetical protein
MIKTTVLSRALYLLGAAAVLGGCASQFKKEEASVEKMPINCATAEGDLRTLQSEKATVAQQIGMGVSTIAPVGLVVGVVTKTEGTKYKVATGEYNKMIDAKIAEIKTTCSIP